MAHWFINYHFFYGNEGLGNALRGPGPDAVRDHIRALKQYARPADSIWQDVETDRPVFTLTTDDGSRSVLDIMPLLREEGARIAVCICGASTLRKSVLCIHKINLLRNQFSDRELWNRLRQQFHTDFSPEQWPLRGGVSADTLYRYDQPDVRRLKTALNYQLNRDQRLEFTDPLFTRYIGPEADMCDQLYLSVDEIRALRNDADIMYHGYHHRFWGDLSDEELADEIVPPPEVAELLSDPYVLSVPYGMPGSWNTDRLVKNAGRARGAFTMGRSPAHNKITDNFWLLHRYDQADIFTRDGPCRRPTPLFTLSSLEAV